MRTDSCRITGDSGLGEMQQQHGLGPEVGGQALTTNEATPAPTSIPVQQWSSSQVPQASDPRSGVDGLPLRPQRPAPPLPTAYQSEYGRRPSRASTTRIASPSGGMQVTLDGGGSWSDLARQDTTLPADANTSVEGKGEGSGGMFGFLKGKKGRNHSPRPKERGVLGKEGARVVIG